MLPAHYSVIRYMPDPGRGERLNIGVLLWTERQYALQFDDAALNRVLRDNPRLERESLYYIAPMIRQSLRGDGDLEGRVLSLLSTQNGFPFDLTEARFTAVNDQSAAGLDEAVEGLVARIVRPKRIGRGSIDGRQLLERRLRPLVRQGKIQPHHVFRAKLTGLERVVDYYANSSVNTALDVLKLSVTKADEIRSRADAEAFKVYDITRDNDLRFVVFCDLSRDRSLQEANESAQRVLRSTGAQVATSLEEAEQAMRDANGRPF